MNDIPLIPRRLSRLNLAPNDYFISNFREKVFLKETIDHIRDKVEAIYKCPYKMKYRPLLFYFIYFCTEPISFLMLVNNHICNWISLLQSLLSPGDKRYRRWWNKGD